jgi:large subunit ribosomal protein L15
MQLHNIKRNTPNTKAPLVGRGGKRGKTSGRGTKGQNARAGRKKRPEIRDFIKRMPKLRGYAFKSFVPKAVPVSLDQVEKHFKPGERVEPATLVAKGLVEKIDGNFPRVKILGGGEITKKVIITDCEISGSAKAAVEKAGGAVHI